MSSAQSKASRPAGASPRFPDPIPGILPFGTLNFFAGASGAGKSRMLAEWWTRWEDGRTICGHATNRPTQLYWLFADRTWYEDGQQIFLPHGRTEIDVPHYNLADDLTITEEHKHVSYAIKLCRRGLEHMKPVPGSIVIIDPISPVFIKGSPNDPRAVAWSLFEYRRMCREYQITIIATAYYTKQKGAAEDRYTRAIDRLAGSGVFAGYGHTVMYIEEPTDERLYHLFGWRPRHAPEAEFNFALDDRNGTFHPYKGLQDASGEVQYDRPTQLLLLIPEDGIDTGDLVQLAMEAFTVSRSSVFTDIKKLKERRQVTQTEYGRLHRRQSS